MPGKLRFAGSENEPYSVRVIAAALLLIVVSALTAYDVARVRYGMGDFKAFYCSARVLAAHEDPYAAAPLARCEREREPWPLFQATPTEVLPAPLPGYAIAAFLPLTLFPFPVACVLWMTLLIASITAACILLARTGVAEAWTAAIALVLLIAQPVLTGELPPFALLGLALAAWGAKRNRWWALATGIGLTFSEPQIGVAVAIVALGLGKRYAIPALVAVLVLGAVTLAALGIGGNVEYVTVVLPAHIASELPNVVQFSLSAALYQLGVHGAAASMLGRLSWYLMLAVAFWFACGAFARKNPDVAFLAAPAFAVVGGPFLHFDHIALAVPAGLWVASHADISRPFRLTVLLAVVLAPLYVFAHIYTLAIVPIMAFWLGNAVYGRTRAGIITAALSVGGMVALELLTLWGGAASHAVAPAYAISSTIAQDAWSREIAAHYAMSGLAVWLVKAPTWFGVAALASALAYIGRGRQRELAAVTSGA